MHRTVGWFTNVYTVNLECSEENDKAIINAKDTLRSVPNAGMGYGYTAHKYEPDIAFNYLGDFGNTNDASLNDYSCGLNIAEENTAMESITMNCSISNGKLEFCFISNKNKFSEEFMEKLKSEFIECVDELADYCSDAVNDYKTSSDLIDTELDNEELDALNALLG